MAKAATVGPSPQKALSKEYETYKKQLPELARFEGKFALIREDELEILDSYQDALMAGYKKYGIHKPFLVQQISTAETPFVIL
jgi:hypothetical protein